MKKNKIKNLLLFFTGFLIIMCARIKHPEGGPIDKDPPKLIGASHEIGTPNFKDDELILEFDKEVDLIKPEQIFITPKAKFSCSAKGKKIRIKFHEKLEENTTYTICFCNSIASYSEKIPTEYLNFSFSTGEKIDEMQITGKISDYLNQTPNSKAIVMLYKEEKATASSKEKMYYELNPPDYCVKVDDKSGASHFKNLKKDKYKICAVENQNSDPEINISTDKYGTYPEFIDLTENSLDSIELLIIKADRSEIKLKNITKVGEMYRLDFNKPIANFETEKGITTMTSLDAKSVYILNINDYKKINGIKNDFSTHIIVHDNCQNKLETEILIKEAELNSEELAIFTPVISKNSKIPNSGEITIYSSKAFNTLRTNPTYITLSIGENVSQITTDDFYFDKNDFYLKIKYNIQDSSKDKLKISVPKDSLASTDGKTNKAFEITYTLVPIEKLGSISGQIRSIEKQYYFIELLDSTYEVVDKIISDEISENLSYTFKNLIPGTYFIRILVSTNEKKFWCPGNDLKKISPDEVIFYSEKIEVMPNWETKDINLNTIK